MARSQTESTERSSGRPNPNLTWGFEWQQQQQRLWTLQAQRRVGYFYY